MGWNLHDVLEIAEPSLPLAPRRFEAVEDDGKRVRSQKKFEALLEDTLIRAMSYHVVMNDSGSTKGLKTRSDEHVDRLRNLCVEYVFSKGEVPACLREIVESSNPVFRDIARLSHAIQATPRVRMESVREVADRVGFVLLPFACLDPRSYAEESKSMQKSITDFDAALDPWFDIYALAPVSYYSLKRHVETETDLQVRPPKGFEQTFLALSMVIPVLREIKRDAKALTRRVDELAGRLAQLEQRVEEDRRLQARDPMLFALPMGQSPDTAATALVGPCWGPDLKDVLLASLQLTTHKHQRKLIESSIKKFFP